LSTNATESGLGRKNTSGIQHYRPRQRIYGDFFNFYLCDLSLKVNGLQPGGPVRSVNFSNSRR